MKQKTSGPRATGRADSIAHTWVALLAAEIEYPAQSNLRKESFLAAVVQRKALERKLFGLWCPEASRESGIFTLFLLFSPSILHKTPSYETVLPTFMWVFLPQLHLSGNLSWICPEMWLLGGSSYHYICKANNHSCAPCHLDTQDDDSKKATILPSMV